MAQRPGQPKENQPILPWAKAIDRFVFDNQGVSGGTTIMTRSHGGTSYRRQPLYPLGNIRSSSNQNVTATTSATPDILTLDTSIFIETVGAIKTSSSDRLTLGRKFSRYLVWGKGSFELSSGGPTSGHTGISIGIFQGAASALLQGSQSFGSLSVAQSVTSIDFVAETFVAEAIKNEGTALPTFIVVQPSTDDERIIRLGAWISNSLNIATVEAISGSVSLMALEIP